MLRLQSVSTKPESQDCAAKSTVQQNSLITSALRLPSIVVYLRGITYQIQFLLNTCRSCETIVMRLSGTVEKEIQDVDTVTVSTSII